MTSTHNINDLKDILIKLYPDVKYEYIDNPRTELSSNSLNVRN